MPRKQLIRSNFYPYHVTLRSNNREEFSLRLVRLWSVFCELCSEIYLLYRAQVHAMVLMPNHLHILITTPQEDLGEVMRHFVGSGTRTINRLSGRSGRVFGGRYHWTLIDNTVYFMYAFKYVYRNPVKAGLVSKVEAYPLSSIQFFLEGQPMPFPTPFPFGMDHWVGIPNDPLSAIEWLNRPFLSEQEKLIQQGLRKYRFALPKRGHSRTSILWNEESIMAPTIPGLDKSPVL